MPTGLGSRLTFSCSHPSQISILNFFAIDKINSLSIEAATFIAVVAGNYRNPDFALAGTPGR
jgi:hypothetical protein